MEPVDELLSIDLCQSDGYYRFRRATPSISTVIYVFVQQLDILPQDCQTYGPDVIRELKKRVEAWNQEWTTLTVFRDQEGKIQSNKDDWKPHHLPFDVIREGIPRLNVLDLDIQQRLKNRVYRIRHGTQQQILKICPFEYELPYMSRELRAYDILMKRGCPLIPTIAAYVYERSSDQVIGFVCEDFSGDVAGPDNYSECRRSLLDLHTYGIVHGDLNKFNIIITPKGPRFIDLEKTVLDSEESVSEDEFLRQQTEEINGLEKALHDNEGWGEPWL